ncbi:MAG: DUF2851 family protein [Bacteroidetes bacterium]|nr:MAG: DUF2851 family protein [Bacteroidota bacterium]
MLEEYIQFIWYTGHFIQKRLQSTTGEDVMVIDQGKWNDASGPDFSNAVVRINGTTWVGNVEMHLRSSDWSKHGHQTDSAYSNVILHVVCEDDEPLYRSASEPHRVPTVILNSEVLSLFQFEYERWVSVKGRIPCEDVLPETPKQTVEEWLESLAKRRYRRKEELGQEILESKFGDIMLAEIVVSADAFGKPLNSEPMRHLANQIPWYKVFRKEWTWTEFSKWLLSMSGLEPFDECHWFNLWAVQPLDGSWWKYGKMRPTSFPRVRVVQWARWIYVRFYLKRVHLVDMVNRPEEVWDEEYGGVVPGVQIRNTWLINMYPLAKVIGQLGGWEEDAFSWNELKPDQNKIVDQFVAKGILVVTANDSQAIIELAEAYCRYKKCVNCAIGRYHLKKIKYD